MILFRSIKRVWLSEDENMPSRVKKNWVLAAGGFALAGAISVQHFLRGLPDFAAGLLFGVAIGILILSLRKPSSALRTDPS